MKRFRFRLDAALRVRSVRDREARAALGFALREAAENERAIEAHSEAAAATTAQVDEAMTGGAMPVDELKRLLDVRAASYRSAEALGARKQQLQRQVDERIAGQARSRRELKVIERLRERDLENWRMEYARYESRESGELFLTRVARESADGE